MTTPLVGLVAVIVAEPWAGCPTIDAASASPSASVQVYGAEHPTAVQHGIGGRARADGRVVAHEERD